MNENQKAFEVADVFNASGDDYKKNHNLTSEQRKAIEDIQKCRTSELGGHTTYCQTCGIIDSSYNSCRNRNCPKCGFQKKIKWLYHQKQNVLPITYYHVVFTLPHELNPLFLFHSNQKVMYQIFFKSVARVIELLSKKGRYFCGKPGMIAILHTWGQTLSFHPHIHCILTGGGLDTINNTWIDKDKFLFPVKVMARLFRRIFLENLFQDVLACEISLPFSYDSEVSRNSFFNGLRRKEWVVYCKEPFDNPNNLIEYLGRYTHRIAISNYRIKSVTKDTVSFSYKDYRDNVEKDLPLKHDEFIRRFLQHVVPSGFMRIRYYGLLANPCRKKLLPICRLQLRDRLPRLEPLPGSWQEYYFQITGQYPGTCRHCKTGILIVVGEIPKKGRDSPVYHNIQSP